jgi:hypothetical protein
MAASIPALTCVSTHRRFDRLGCYAKRIRGLENGTWSAINENTAMMEMEYGDERSVKLKDAIAVCRDRGIPSVRALTDLEQFAT